MKKHPSTFNSRKRAVPIVPVNMYPMPYAGKEGVANSPPPSLLRERKRDRAEDTNLVQNLIKNTGRSYPSDRGKFDKHVK